MPGLRTRVRKVEPASLPSFDEQLWPIYAAILVLAAFLSGVIVSTGSFQTTQPWRHPLVGLAGVALITVLWIWLVRRVSTHRIRRVTWLASLVSLFIHAVLVVVLAGLQLFSRPADPAKSLAFRDRDPKAIVVPEYAVPPVQPANDQTPVFDRPVDAELADNAEPSLPRTAAATTDQLESSRPTAVPVASPSELAASLPPRQPPDREIASPSNLEVTPLTRRMSRQRRFAPSNRVERVHQLATSAAVRSRPDIETVHELSRQQVAVSPIQDRDISDWTEVTDAPSFSSSQPTRASYTEGLAVADPMQTPRRMASVPTRDSTVEEVPEREPAAPDSALVAEFALADQPSTAERRDSLMADMSKAEFPMQAGPMEATIPQVLRAESECDPTMDPRQPLRELPRRALRVAERESSPVEMALPWITETHRSSEPQVTDPAPAALAQSTDGSAGLGRESSFLDQERGADRAAPVAHNSALRRQTTQTMETDMAIAPSEPVRLPRRTAQHAVRSEAEGSIPLPQPSPAGEPSPAETSADAAAVARRSAANATRDLVTASVGEASFDTGPPQMERATPLARASGGGQPEFNFRPPEPTRRRDVRGRPPSAALRAEQLAASPAAELGQGGGTVFQENAVDDAADLVPSTAGMERVTQLRPRVTSAPGGDAAMAVAPRSASPQRVTSSSRGDRGDIATDLRPLRRRERRSSPFVASVSAEVLQPAGQPEAAAPVEAIEPANEGPGRFDSGEGLPLADFRRNEGPETMPVETAMDFPSLARQPRRQTAIASPADTPSTGRPAANELVGQPMANLSRRRDPSVASRRPGRELSIVVSTPAFSQRRARREIGPGRGLPAPLPKTEQSVERGLLFLARYQATDGRWSLHQWGEGHPDFDREVPSLRSDTAATGLALLAFLGAGYHHRTDPYDTSVAQGLEYLLRNQSPDGNLFIGEDELSNRSVALYSHAIATLAISEAYGMTQDPALREPAQRAVAYVVASQHPQWGGWRYAPGISSDTSVSGWMALALRSAELAELRVPTNVYPGIDRWLSAAQASDQMPHLYRYNPNAPNTQAQRQGRRPTQVMTAVGLLMRMLRGTDRNGPMLQAGAAYLREHLPAVGTRRRPQRDTYYWYYGTQVMFHMGGDDWERWNASLHPLLVGEQVSEGDFAGSWDPLWPIPDRWGPHAGRLYVTTMNLLSLEVYYRHLPLYESHR